MASLLAILLLGAAVGVVWHSHDKSPLHNCQICHLAKHHLANPSARVVVHCPSRVELHRQAQEITPRIPAAFRHADFRAPPA